MADLLAVSTPYGVLSSREKRAATAGSDPAAAGCHTALMNDNSNTEGSFGNSDALQIADEWQKADKHPPRRADRVTGIDMSDEDSEWAFGLCRRDDFETWLVSDTVAEVQE